VYTIRKVFTFEAAHQLEDAYTEACHQCIHGHSYTVELYLSATHLDTNRMVLDFGELRSFKEQVMVEWDHGLLLHEDKKPFIEPLIEAGVLKREKVSFLPNNPTAEEMARLLAFRLTRWLSQYAQQAGKVIDYAARHVRVARVRIHETSTGWAAFEPLNA
jgi:6-pyruvoyltetrahydropterin/6-carboxytetrahydropterin synthase